MRAGDERAAGTVLQIQSFSVHDGEGVRSVVFLPGCPLRCKWCSNPETWTAEPKLAFYKDKCAGCGMCQEACPQGIFPARGGRERCSACGRCVSACPRDALKILCKRMTVDEVVRRLLRDEIFFRHSGGGVTFSGGEPTVQGDFLRALAQRLHRGGIDMCIETCGYFDWDAIGDIFRYMSHVFLDLKCMDEAKHIELTGRGNKLILENAVRIIRAGVGLTVRVPCVVGANFTEDNLRATALFTRDNLPGADLELLPYHDLGNEKYGALGMERFMNRYSAPDRERLAEAEALINSLGVKTVSYK